MWGGRIVEYGSNYEVIEKMVSLDRRLVDSRLWTLVTGGCLPLVSKQAHESILWTIGVRLSGRANPRMKKDIL